jgi:UDP-N-acetylglucosamine acyltransferase
MYVHPTAIIYPNVIIEPDVYIGPYCIIGAPAEWKGYEHHEGLVTILSGARLTGMVTVDSGTERRTIIGKDCYLQKKVHVGHDAIICEGTTLSCHSIVGGHTVVGKHCNIGLSSILHQKITIPDYVMIGMGGIVTKKSKLESFNIYAGNPVKYLKQNDYLINQFPNEYNRNI